MSEEKIPLSVLFLEDSAFDVKVSVRQLEKAGFVLDLDVVSTEEQFLSAMRSGKNYDVILSDYNIPGWSGIDALDALQKAGRDIPFILITGTLSEETAVACIKRGISDYILKDRQARLPVAILRSLRDKAARETEVQRNIAEAALRLEKEQAEQASQFKDQFLSMMSHDLRTPLTAILGFTELLLDRRFGSLNEKQLRYMDNINKSGMHLLRLINDILDLSKVSANRLEVSLGPVKVGEVFEEIVTALRPLADKKSQVLISVAEEGLAVHADHTRFTQVLTNLTGNAIKFTPAGGRIELTARRDGDRAYVEVCDNGKGIPAEEQARIFDAFYCLPRAGSPVEGTGLGLAISQKLVELQGGQLGVVSQPGEGACFHFTLPLFTTESFVAESN